ncbi:UNVERIFIED_CONTAM: AP-4 complex subunit epsilon [Sesamum calycinum]|uniref:AP-4 complex subunit epsilon n=1 Tax=Sesamum calycinum TaxID=2727403 RepID=A0AAW2QW54_9LAMI
MGSQGGFGQSKEFLDLIKSIGEARSKAEEDRIVLGEIETLKVRLNDPNTSKFKLKEYVIRLLYVEVLGHDASFGYIHAVKMTHDENLHLKRTGYLAVTLFLNEDHDLIILIVNTIQKDLKSDNYLVVCAALNAVCRLINEETIPAVLPQVVALLGHQKEAVRKKAVMALHRFYQKSPGSVSHLISHFRKRDEIGYYLSWQRRDEKGRDNGMVRSGLVLLNNYSCKNLFYPEQNVVAELSDNDPGVMGAALCPLFDLILIDVNSYKDLVVSFVNILKQVAERRLPKSYDYHQMPAPFIQHASFLMALGKIKLLKILALLGNGDKKASEQMYTIVGDIMKKCHSTSNIGNAVLYECICCVSSLHPNPNLLGAAADAISKFLKSDSHNLKYLGIDALSRLIKISPEIAEQHQLAVIDCLEVDKNLSFLHGYVQQSLENGAQPYIPESERAGISNVSNFKSQQDHEPSTHTLRFEAYELPKPSPPPNIPPVLVSSTELVPIPELSSVADILQTAPSASDAGSSELKLRLDGVQRKWGRPAFSSVTPSTSSTNSVNVQNEAAQRDSAGSSNSKVRDASYDSKKQQVEVPPEKQQLVASLFGGASKSEKRQSSIQKMPKSQNQAAETSHVSKAAASRTPTVKTSQLPPDLLDLSEPSVTSSAPSIDPFKQLEGLLDLTQDTTSQTASGVSGTEGPEFSLFADMSLSVQSDGAANSISNVSDRNGLGGTTIENLVKSNKGPNLKEALERDAHVRQMGVTPSGQNPNLFKDLLS